MDEPKDWGVYIDQGWIREELYQQANKKSVFTEYAPLRNPIPAVRLGYFRSRWLRLRWWFANHRPYMHFGPCDHSECE